MTDIEKVEQKIAATIKRREKIKENMKKITAEAKDAESRITTLAAKKKRLLCGRFGALLEKNAISIEDVDLDEIVAAIGANQGWLQSKKYKNRFGE